MGSIGAPELLIILVLVLLVFGGAKLPKLARSLGQAQKEFKTGLSEGSADAKSGEQGGQGRSGSTGGNRRSGSTAAKNGSA